MITPADDDSDRATERAAQTGEHVERGGRHARNAERIGASNSTHCSCSPATSAGCFGGTAQRSVPKQQQVDLASTANSWCLPLHFGLFHLSLRALTDSLSFSRGVAHGDESTEGTRAGWSGGLGRVAVASGSSVSGGCVGWWKNEAGSSRAGSRAAQLVLSSARPASPLVCWLEKARRSHSIHTHDNGTTRTVRREIIQYAYRSYLNTPITVM
jgi:hypothetical protein